MTRTGNASVNAWRLRGALLSLVATACVAGCAVPGDSTDSSVDDPSPATPVDPPEDSLHETGVLHVKTSSGIVPLTYAVRNGKAIYQGDVVLGDVEAVRREEAQRSVAIRSLGARWPGAHIDFMIDPAVPATLVTLLTNAIATYQTLTPITFTQVPFSVLTQGLIVVGVSTIPGVSSSDWIGYPTGVNSSVSLNLWPGDANNPPATPRNAVHELGHALGLYHEQSRSDRDLNVVFTDTCVQAGFLDQFDMEDITGSAEALAPYDLTSVMHYGSTFFCIPATATEFPVPGTNCKCLPLVKLGTTSTSAAGIINPFSVLSKEDINTLWKMYEPMLGTNVKNDDLGSAMVAGDFDNDGYTDVAVGAPGDTLAFSPVNSGAVYLFKGTSGGLVAWRVVRQETSGLSVGSADDRFGSALAVGDFDGDGFADLFVGAPGDTISGASGRPGSVFVFKGSQAGPVPVVRLDQASLDTNEDGDEFGTALTVGDYNGDGKLDLAVGAPGEVVTSNATKAGAVYVFKGTGTGFTAWKNLTQNLFSKEINNAGDRFGQALASGDFTGDGFAELVVGVPETGLAGAPGAVDIWTRSTTNPATNSLIAFQDVFRQKSADVPAAGDAFGTSLVVGDFNGDGKADLAVGAPGKDSPTDSGRVVIFTKGATQLVESQLIGLSAAPLAGDRMGQALGIIDFNMDGKSDLLVGVPNRDTVGTDNGAVMLLKGTALSLVAAQLYLNTNATPDRFGSAFASGNFDKIADIPDFVTGMPGASAAAGAFYFFQGSLIAPTDPGGGYFDQQTQTPE